jgi:hypothetical protein
MAQLVQEDRRYPCCRVEENLELVTSAPATLPAGRYGNVTTTAPVPATETMRRCLVCGRRHFELGVDPGALGLRGSAAG